MHFGQQFTERIVLLGGFNLNADPARAELSKILNDPTLAQIMLTITRTGPTL